jgi:CubicO group peptidase (beta-lactamase class C family)
VNSIRVAILASLVLAAAILPACGDAPKVLEPPEVMAIVSNALKEWDVPGVAVVVVDREHVLWLQGHGIRDVETRQPMSDDCLFPLASCTKAFTATIIAMLAEEGKLAWDDPVHRHDSEFRLADPCASDATFRDLLTHRTGLASHDYLWYRATWLPEDGVRRAGLLPLEHAFRTRFQYQSVMATAAGFAAAKAAGAPWETLVEQRIFRPLEMTRARCTTPPAGANRASPHKQDNSGRVRVMPWYEQTLPNPAGSIHASARDLVGWLQFQLSRGAWHGRKLLSAAALEETLTPQMALRLEGLQRDANPETHLMSYALGWVVQDYRGHLLVSHAGALDGFRAHITLMPKSGMALALLANRHQTRMNLALSNALVDRLLGLPAREWNRFYRDLSKKEEESAQEKRRHHVNSRRPDIPPSLPLSAFAGSYEHPAYGTATIAIRDGSLHWDWSGFHGRMQHHAGDEFDIDDENLIENGVKFQIKDGKAAALEFLNLVFRKKQDG